MLTHLAALLVALGASSGAALAQTPVRAQVAMEHRGPAARLLRDVLEKPHLAVLSDAVTLGLPRDTTFTTGVVVIGTDVTVASVVQGDMVVIGGDLFLRPGARISGRAIAIGGGVYDSFLARVDGDRIAIRDLTFDPIVMGDEVLLAERSLEVDDASPIAWPGLYGVRIPSYNRVDGLALSVGPRLAWRRLQAEPLLTYRSHLGEVDPSLAIEVATGRRSAIEAVAERGTFTNDAWARPDVLNSAAALVFGGDQRNYWRATRYTAGVRLDRTGERAGGTVRLGVRSEDARSVGPLPGATSEPWSIFGRHDTTEMLRPNPPIVPGRIVSVLPQVEATWADGELTSRGSLGVEIPVESVDDREFVQATLDASIAFPTVSNHRFSAQLHAVWTASDTAPPQRFAYLGGGSTLPTREELSLGGDQLFFVEGVYEVPLPRPELPFVGAPVLGVRYAVGSAGVARLPAFVQNIGIMARVSLLKVEFLVDPASGETAFRIGGSAWR